MIANHARLQSHIPMIRTSIVAAGVLVTCVILGAAVVVFPPAALVPLAALATVGFARSAVFRFAFVSFGGLIILQSSEGIDVRKLLYMLGCAVALSIAMGTVWKNMPGNWAPIVKPLLTVSMLWAILVLFSFFISMMYGTPVSNWLRDSTQYLLFATSPILAIDAAVNLAKTNRAHLAQVMFVSFGVASTLTFAANFLSTRGYIELGIDRVFLTSFAFPGALFSFACAKSMSGDRHAGLWATTATCVLAMLMLTGTRTTLIMAIIPLTLVLLLDRNPLRSVKRSIIPLIVGAIVALGLLAVVIEFSNIDTSSAFNRFLTLGDIASDSVAGQSFEERSAQTLVQLEIIRQSPLWGVGPGYVYEWINSQGGRASAFVLDSPLSIPARFGMLGALLFVFTLVAILKFAKRIPSTNRDADVFRNALVAFIAFTIVLSLLSSPMDDKGFSFAASFLILIGLLKIPGPAKGSRR